MLFRCVSLALMSICFSWSIGAIVASHYIWSFYEDEVPKNDMQPVWTALLLGLVSIVVAAAMLVANRVVKIKAIEAFEAARGSFNEENRAFERPSGCLWVMQLLNIAFMVPWIVQSLLSTYKSFSVEGEFYKVFSVAAHFINTVAPAVFGILIGHFAYIDAQVVYLVHHANMANEVHPVANRVRHAGRRLNNVQRADPAGQQIELQELNPMNAPLQIQNHE